MENCHEASRRLAVCYVLYGSERHDGTFITPCAQWAATRGVLVSYYADLWRLHVLALHGVSEENVLLRSTALPYGRVVPGVIHTARESLRHATLHRHYFDLFGSGLLLHPHLPSRTPLGKKGN